MVMAASSIPSSTAGRRRKCHGGEPDEAATEFLPGSRIEISIADGDSPEAAKLLQQPTDFAVRHRTKRGFWGCQPMPWAQASVLAAEFVHARVWGILRQSVCISLHCLCKSIRPLCRGWSKSLGLPLTEFATRWLSIFLTFGRV